MSYTVCPAYLAIQSRQAVKEVKLPTTTKYTSYLTSEWIAWLLILLSTILICAVFSDAFLTLSESAAEPLLTMEEDDLF